MQALFRFSVSAFAANASMLVEADSASRPFVAAIAILQLPISARDLVRSAEGALDIAAIHTGQNLLSDQCSTSLARRDQVAAAVIALSDDGHRVTRFWP